MFIFSRLTIILKCFMLFFHVLFECLFLILEMNLLMALKKKQPSGKFYFCEVV